MSVCLRFLENFFIKKDLQKGFSRYIILNMNENSISCPPDVRRINSTFRAIESLSLLLLRRLPPRLTTQDVAAGKAQ